MAFQAVSVILLGDKKGLIEKEGFFFTFFIGHGYLYITVDVAVGLCRSLSLFVKVDSFISSLLASLFFV